jgi:hypothetical protein
MNGTKRKLYDTVTWGILEQVDNLYGHNAIDLYKADEHTGDIIELVKEQLRYDIKYKCKK